MSVSEPHRPEAEEEEEEDEILPEPWYQDTLNSHPFTLVRKISQQTEDAPAFRCLALFPWSDDSLSTLWKGVLNTDDVFVKWKEMILEYWDAVAVGSDQHIYIFFTHKKKAPICVELPEINNEDLIEADVPCVAWGLSHRAPYKPVVIFCRGSLVWIYSPDQLGMVGFIRGHGGAITSVGVHPTNTNLFYTTSRDLTTRIYDLELDIVPNDEEKALAGTKRRKAKKGPKKPDNFNPHWPPSKKPSLAGPAHGLRPLPSEALRDEREGYGAGRCIVVLMGGRSGGHQAAVLGAAFHPVYPLIATCGMDRCVKIWPVRPTASLEIKREDKPLFTSSRVHKARVLSISWLQDDLLLTHSAPALMRKSPMDTKDKETYLEAGELIIWRWLGVDRFFPATHEGVPPIVLRGCSSDYQESSSFKLISIHAFPMVPSQHTVPNMSLFQSPTHDPLVLFVYPGEANFTVVNLSHLMPRKRPPFPLRAEDFEGGGVGGGGGGTMGPPPAVDVGTSMGAGAGALASATEQLHIADTQAVQQQQQQEGQQQQRRQASSHAQAQDQEQDNDSSSSSEDTDDTDTGTKLTSKVLVRNVRMEVDPPPIEGWELRLRDVDVEGMGLSLRSVAMGSEGRMIVGVGTRGSLWVWRNDV